MAVTENGTSTVYVNSLWTDEEAFLNDATRPADAVWGVNAFAKFTDALNFAAKNAAVTKIEVGSDVTETDVVSLEDVTHDLEIVASEGKTVTVTIPGATAGAGDSICIEEGATLTIGEGVKFNQFDQVVPGYTGTGSLVVNSDVSFNRIQSWGNSTVTINKTGSVNLTGDDGYLYFVGNQAFLNVYGNLTGTDNESLKTAKKSLHIGYANMRDYWNSGNTITFNFEDAYITCGRSFDSSANKLVFNADNSVFEMVGGDAPGYITLSNTVEFNLSNDARIITSTLTANAGSVVSFAGGSLEAQTFTNNGTFTVGGVSTLNIASGSGNIDLEGTLAAGSNAGGMTIRAQGTDAKIVGEADKATKLGIVKVNGSSEYSDTAVALEISGTNITTSTLYIGTTGGATTGNKLTITGDNNRETLDVKSGAFYVKAKNDFVLNDVNFSAGQYSINGTMTVTNSVLTCDDASFGVYSGGSLSITNSTLTTWTNKGNLNGGIFLGDGGNGWGYAPSVGTMEVLEGSSVKTTAVVLKSSQNALTVKNSSIEAVTKISVGEDAKVTLEGTATLATDAMDNAGTITMDASSDITAKAITGTGDLVIKLTADEIASGVTDKVIDVTDGSAFDSITVVDADGNAVAGFGAFRAEDGDVWVSNADMTTLYVDSAWSTEYKFGDAITGIEGAVYGMNAFADYASAKAAVSNVTENMIIAGDINAGGVFDNLIEVGEDLAYWSGPSPVENTFAVEVNAAVKSGSTVLNNNTVTVGETGSIEAFDHHLTVFGEAGSLVVDGDADGSVRNTEKQLAVSQLRVAFGGSADIRDTTIEVRAITVGADAWDDTGYSSTLTLTNTTVEYQGFGDGSQLNINVKEGNTLSIADSELVKKNASSTIAVVNNGAFELSGTVLEAVSVANAGAITVEAGSSLSVNGTLTIGAYLNFSGLTANTDYGFNIDGVKFDTTADANGNIRLFTTALTDGEKSVTLIDPTSWTSVSTTVTVTNGSLTVNVDSAVEFATLDAAAESIIVDTDGYTDGTKRILNNKGADLTKADYEAVVKGDAALDATVGAGKFIVANGDLYLTDAKQDVLYVNSTYTEESAAEDGKILGYNAFNTMQAALDVLENGPATLNITGETADTTASVTLTEGGEYGITGGNGNHINEIFVRNGDKEITEANRISLTFEGADVVFSKFGEEKVDGEYFGNYDVEITDSIVSGKFYLGYGDQAFMTVRGNSTFKVNNSLFGFDAGASAAFKDLPVGAAATKEADILPLNGSGVQGVLGMAYGDDSVSEITDSTVAFRSFNVGCGADVTIDNSVVYLCGGMGIGASYYGAGAEGKVASVTVTGGSIVRDLAWGSHGGAYDPISIGEDTAILGTALLRVEDGSEFSYMSSVFNGKPAGYPAITVGSKGAVEVENATFKASSVKIDNNGSFTVSSTEEGKSSTLNIGTLTGGSIKFLDGAVIKDSKIGGEVFVAGNVTFRGDNDFAMIYDYGTLTDYYDTTAPMAWTVEAGASVTLHTGSNGNRYGLGYGDKVTINGVIAENGAAAARAALNDDDDTNDVKRSFYAEGLVAQESKGWNCDSSFTVNNAYVTIGNASSFGNKPGNYGGTYTFSFDNAVVDASRITFYEALSTTTFTFKNSDVKMGQFMTRDKDSVFTLDNSTVLSTAPSSGNDEGNYNAAELNVINGASLTYSSAMKNEADGEINVNTNGKFTVNGAFTNEADASVAVTGGTFTADSVTNSGSITVENSVFSAGTVTGNGTFTVSGTSSISGDFTQAVISAAGATINTNGLTDDALIAGVTYGAGNFTITGAVGAGTVDVSAGTKMIIESADLTGALVFDDAAATITVNKISYTGSLSRNGVTIVDGVDNAASIVTINGVDYTIGEAAGTDGVSVKWDGDALVASKIIDSDNLDDQTITDVDGSWIYAGADAEDTGVSSATDSLSLNIELTANDTAKSRVFGGQQIIGESTVQGGMQVTEVNVDGMGIQNGIYGGNRIQEDATLTGYVKNEVNVNAAADAQFGGQIVGGSFVVEGTMSTIGTTSVAIGGAATAVYNAVIAGGSAVSNGSSAYNNGDSVVTIDNGIFNNSIYGGGYVQKDGQFRCTNTSITINGGEFNGKIYGGNGEAASCTKDNLTLIENNTSIAISGGKFEGNIYGGSFGLGKVNGSSTIEISGGTFGDIVIDGDSSNAEFYNKEAVADRNLIFNGYDAALEANIRNFDTVKFLDDSDIDMTNGTFDAAEVDVWSFENGASIKGLGDVAFESDSTLEIYLDEFVADSTDGDSWTIMTGSSIDITELDNVIANIDGSLAYFQKSGEVWQYSDYTLSLEDGDTEDSLVVVKKGSIA